MAGDQPFKLPKLYVSLIRRFLIRCKDHGVRPGCETPRDEAGFNNKSEHTRRVNKVSAIQGKGPMVCPHDRDCRHCLCSLFEQEFVDVTMSTFTATSAGPSPEFPVHDCDHNKELNKEASSPASDGGRALFVYKNYPGDGPPKYEKSPASEHANLPRLLHKPPEEHVK
ncbi:hypothetical protein BDY19DRAFT_906881 [Irpex rosettiformis]|uniref:Uncharacterized protein n=1 Tax=Irpex rosettiformis TaxID=378272 RepID=A0ACB8U2E1_9APHY|nr:hypothetical protein BDY19DRAFT_906881 [Irpex rosettiformis]